MEQPILIVGTRALARALGVGRTQIQAWLDNEQSGFPAYREHDRAPWISTRQNLIDWSNARFASRPRRPVN